MKDDGRDRIPDDADQDSYDIWEQEHLDDCEECAGQGWIYDEEDGGTKCCPADCDNGKA